MPTERVILFIVSTCY